MPGSTVLIIEDNTIQREGLAAVLRQEGFTVLTASDGADALNQLSNCPIPDLILLDMLNPRFDGDGWWFLERRKLIPVLSSVPIIITTGLSIAGKEWAASLGAAGLLHKPFEVGSIMAEIRRCLGKTEQTAPGQPV